MKFLVKFGCRINETLVIAQIGLQPQKGKSDICGFCHCQCMKILSFSPQTDFLHPRYREIPAFFPQSEQHFTVYKGFSHTWPLYLPCFKWVGCEFFKWFSAE